MDQFQNEDVNFHNDIHPSIMSPTGVWVLHCHLSDVRLDMVARAEL